MSETDPTRSSDAETEREVLAAEDRRYQAMRDGDLAALDELCADELSYTHSSGSRDTKAEFLAKVGSGHYVYLSIDHPVERVGVYGDTAVVVGRMAAELEVQGTPKTLDNFALAVWTRTSGAWRLVAYAPTPRAA
jgi:ketosteroid isomerase-like protein